jgi:hypothetical protein
MDHEIIYLQQGAERTWCETLVEQSDTEYIIYSKYEELESENKKQAEEIERLLLITYNYYKRKAIDVGLGGNIYTFEEFKKKEQSK